MPTNQYLVEYIELDDCRAAIFYDSYPTSPREYSEHTSMLCVHSRHILGDNTFHSIDGMLSYMEEKYSDQYDITFRCDRRDIDAFIRWLDRHFIWMPLYLYDHSGLTISTTPFSCPWDSDQVGFIVITKDKVRELYEWKKITPKRRDLIKKSLKGEVELYDKYLRGETYQVDILDQNNKVIESISDIAGYESCLEVIKEYGRK